jgi:hypothetical protein
MADTSAQGPVTLRVAVWLLAVEAVALGAFALYLVGVSLFGEASTGLGAAGVVVFLALIAVVVGAAAWALRQRRAWARGPAIVLHMLLFPFGLASISSHEPLLGAFALVLGAFGAAVLLAPATRIAVGRE